MSPLHPAAVARVARWAEDGSILVRWNDFFHGVQQQVGYLMAVRAIPESSHHSQVASAIRMAEVITEKTRRKRGSTGGSIAAVQR